MVFDDDELSCPKCSETFEDARILPCGDTVCQKCIEKSTSKFECPCCHVQHSVPKSGGFQKNTIISKLVQKKRPDEHLKKLIDSVLQSAYSLNQAKKSCANLHEKCQSVRDEINSTHDTYIEEINRHRDSLLSQLVDYEKRYTDIISMADRTLNEAADCYENYFTNSDSLPNMIKSCQEMVKSLESNLNNLKHSNVEPRFIPKERSNGSVDFGSIYFDITKEKSKNDFVLALIGAWDGFCQFIHLMLIDIQKKDEKLKNDFKQFGENLKKGFQDFGQKSENGFKEFGRNTDKFFKDVGHNIKNIFQKKQ